MSDALKALNQKNLGVDSLNRGTTPLPLYEEGESLTALKVVPSAGIDPATGKEIFIKRDGTYTFTYDPNDRRVFGDTSPWAYGSLTSYLMYKGFSLNANSATRSALPSTTLRWPSRVEGTKKEQNADRRVLESRWKQAGDVTATVTLPLRRAPIRPAASSRRNTTSRCVVSLWPMRPRLLGSRSSTCAEHASSSSPTTSSTSPRQAMSVVWTIPLLAA